MKSKKRLVRPLNRDQKKAVQIAFEGGKNVLTFSGQVSLDDNVPEHVVVELCKHFKERLEKLGETEMSANITTTKDVDAKEFFSKAEPTPKGVKGKSLLRDGYLVPKIEGEDDGCDNTKS